MVFEYKERQEILNFYKQFSVFSLWHKNLSRTLFELNVSLLMPIIALKKTQQLIHLAVWEITETHDELLAMLSSEILTDAELAEIHHPAKQIEFFASRLCIQYLANSLNIKYLGLKKDEYGKPFLVGSTWQMSLTHTVRYIAVVMHPYKPLGIDMEKPTEKLRRIAHKFLSDKEAIDAENDIEKLSIYWSAKEVLYKIYGKRKVIFNENLYIFPYNKHQKLIKGEITITNEPEQNYHCIVELEVSKWGDFYMVIGS